MLIRFVCWCARKWETFCEKRTHTEHERSRFNQEWKWKATAKSFRFRIIAILTIYRIMANHKTKLKVYTICRVTINDRSHTQIFGQNALISWLNDVLNSEDLICSKGCGLLFYRLFFVDVLVIVRVDFGVYLFLHVFIILIICFVEILTQT